MGNRLITFEGTSIDVGGNSLQNYVAYYSQVPTTMQSPATPGATIADWQARIATTQASLHATDFNLFVLGGPANNFGNVGTQAAELASYLSYVASMKAYGISSGKKLKIVASTMIPHAYAAVAAYRTTFANAIKARVGIDIDAVIDYSIDSILGPNSTSANTLYFDVDGIHPTVKGQANMGRVSAPVLDTFINVTTGVRRFRTVKGVPDVTAPTVVSYSPADNAINIAVDVGLVVTFNETVTLGTGTISLKKTSDNSIVEEWNVATEAGSTAGKVEVVDGTALHLHLTSNLANNTGCYVVWSAGVVKDAANNGVAAQSSTTLWSFTTVAAATGWTSPLDASTPAVFWVDASNLASITKVGTAVSQWNDLTTGAHHLTAPAGDESVYTTGVINGLPGIDTAFRSGFKSTAFIVAQPVMVVVVWKTSATAPAAQSFLLDGDRVAAAANRLILISKWTGGNYNTFANSMIDQGVAVATNTAYHSRAIFTQSPSSASSSSKLNASVVSGTSPGIGSIQNGIALSSTAYSSQAIYCEVYVISNPTSTDVINSDAYVLAKWGLS